MESQVFGRHVLMSSLYSHNFSPVPARSKTSKGKARHMDHVEEDPLPMVDDVLSDNEDDLRFVVNILVSFRVTTPRFLIEGQKKIV